MTSRSHVLKAYPKVPFSFDYQYASKLDSKGPALFLGKYGDRTEITHPDDGNSYFTVKDLIAEFDKNGLTDGLTNEGVAKKVERYAQGKDLQCFTGTVYQHAMQILNETHARCTSTVKTEELIVSRELL